MADAPRSQTLLARVRAWASRCGAFVRQAFREDEPPANPDADREIAARDRAKQAGFREVTKAEFKKIYFRRGGGPYSGWTADYWDDHFEDAAGEGWKFMVQDPASPSHDQMWIVTDRAARAYRLFFLTDASTENFFDHPGKE